MPSAQADGEPERSALVVGGELVAAQIGGGQFFDGACFRGNCRDAEFLCASVNTFEGGGVLGGVDEGDAGLQDAGFFGGDGLDGVTEPALVVEVNRGDGADVWGDGGGGVEPSAESDFEYRQSGIRAGEMLERHRGQRFKVTRVVGQRAVLDQSFKACFDFAEDGGELFVADGFAVDGDAFVHPAQVRRGVEPGAEARRAREGLDHGRHRAFPVGPGDVDDGEALLGVAEVLVHPAHALEVPFARPSFEAELQQPLDSFIVARSCYRGSHFTSTQRGKT